MKISRGRSPRATSRVAMGLLMKAPVIQASLYKLVSLVKTVIWFYTCKYAHKEPPSHEVHTHDTRLHKSKKKRINITLS